LDGRLVVCCRVACADPIDERSYRDDNADMNLEPSIVPPVDGVK